MNATIQIMKNVLFLLGASAMYFITVILISFGIGQIIYTVVFAPAIDVAKSHDWEALPPKIPGVLEGLEYLFLAPLGFLLFRGIWDYLAAVVNNANPQVASHHFIMRVKALILGLMVAVMATDILKRSLSQSGLDGRVVLTECLFIVVIGSYSIITEILSR